MTENCDDRAERLWIEAGSPVVHRMVSGSHERPGGPECRCGAEWDWWADSCTSGARQEVANVRTEN